MEGLFYVNGKKVILAGSLALLVSMTLVGCGSGPAEVMAARSSLSPMISMKRGGWRIGSVFCWRGNCKLSFRHVLQRYHIQDDAIDIVCRALTPAEAIGANVKRHDFPILTGKDVIPQKHWPGKIRYNDRGRGGSPARSSFLRHNRSRRLRLARLETALLCPSLHVIRGTAVDYLSGIFAGVAEVLSWTALGVCFMMCTY